MARRKKTEKRELSHEDIPRNTRATAWRLLGRMARQWWKLLLVAGAALLSSASFTAIPLAVGMGIDRLVDLKAEARRVINAVSDPDQQLILELRYLCYKPWNEIMTELGYSEPTIYRLHGEALKKICVPVKNDSF